MKRIAIALAIAGCGSKPEPGVLNMNDDGGQWRVTGREVAFKDLPLGDLGLPFIGAKVDVDLRVPVAKGKRDYARATGFVAMTCPTGCQIGDDKTKIVPSSPRTRAFIGDGIEFGHLTVDTFDVRIEIADGHVNIARWLVASNDVALDLAGDITLATNLDDSRIEACLRFKPTDALRQRDPKTYAVLTVLGATMDAQGDYTIRITDRLGHPRMLPSCGPAAAQPITRPSLSP